eukprot:TRINITY_DN21225_c0_g1_i1.p1 TRINITY_DN21225_c0_g1~~TRINITY_DN21225_c0_g1_i1.p1  ORF type:complete len:1605 (+),score=289.64 TRINITY_DN21225_c0_g1_i1:188-5002(+)
MGVDDSWRSSRAHLPSSRAQLVPLLALLVLGSAATEEGESPPPSPSPAGAWRFRHYLERAAQRPIPGSRQYWQFRRWMLAPPRGVGLGSSYVVLEDLDDTQCKEVGFVEGATAESPKRCVLNKTVHTERDLTLDFGGDIDVTGQLSTRTNVNFVANGSIRIHDKAVLQADRVINLKGTWVTLEELSLVKAVGNIQAASANSEKMKVVIKDHSTLKSDQGTITLLGGHIEIGGRASVICGKLLSIGGDSRYIRLRPRRLMGGLLGRQPRFPRPRADADFDLLQDPVLVEQKSGAPAGGLWEPAPEDETSVSSIVSIDGQAALDPQGGMNIIADNAYVGHNVSLRTTQITIKAAGIVQLNASTLPGPAPVSEQAPLPMVLSVSTAGPLILGSWQATWRLHGLTAVAHSVYLQGSYIQVDLHNSCKNKRSSKQDVCQDLVFNWTESADGSARIAARASKSNTNVTFDMAIVSGKGGTNIYAQSMKASSMLVCSAGDVILHKHSTLDASGRGCGPGQGEAPGLTEPGCGGAGGSFMGTGGFGATYDNTAVNLCALPAAKPRQDLSLPTAGASGGGCGMDEAMCRDLGVGNVYTPGAGGGLIWVSGAKIRLGSQSAMMANGMKGIVSWTGGISVSGGGAGGQILLVTPSLLGDETSADSPATLSAMGGGSSCSKSRVGGGGGGGFVGFRNYGTPQTVGSNSTVVNVSGGFLEDECEALAFLESAGKLRGAAGTATALDLCQPGHSGFFCLGCEVGTYSDDGGLKCKPCNTKPDTHMAEYMESSWPNSSCPYRCLPGVPNVKVNPLCSDSLPYVWQFFGGFWGGIVILTCFFLISVFLAWRRFRKVARRAQTMARGSWSTDVQTSCPWLSWLVGPIEMPSPRHAVGSTAFARACRTGELRFTTEQLPYHIYRVYLSGTNSSKRPWALEKGVPQNLEAVVNALAWESFASQITTCARERRVERTAERFLRVLYAPLADICLLRLRHRRARRLQSLVNLIADGGQGQRVLWNPMYGTPGRPELAVAFGCDTGATLGYLDIFDFARSQLDWAPVDLRHEVRLLVAHGEGSYNEPFAIDIGDPLVHHLSQTDFGAHSVCSVISTFNRIARLLREADLRPPAGSRGAEGPMVQRLRFKVEQCAARCGLSGSVKVLTLVQRRGRGRVPRRSGVSVANHNAGSFWDLILHTPDPSANSPGVASPVAASLSPRRSASPRWEVTRRGPPFGQPPHLRHLHYSDGSVRHLQSECSSFERESSCPSPEMQGRLRPLELRPAQDLEQTSNMSPDLCSPEALNVERGDSGPLVGEGEVCLCLAFTDCTALLSAGQRLQAVREGSAHLGCGAVSSAITSPMSQQELVEHLSLGELNPDLDEGEAPEACSRSWWRAIAWRDHANRAPLAVVLLLVSLLFADLMAFILAGAMLYAVTPWALAAYMLLPPASQLVALASGPLFVLMENPRLGRFYASVQLLSLLGPASMAFILAFVLQVDSWTFDLLGMVTICVIKLSVYVIVHFHVANLEAAHDLRFAHASQADFLGRILAPAGDVRGPRVWSLDHIEERDTDPTERDESEGRQTPRITDRWREGGFPTTDSSSSILPRDPSSGNRRLPSLSPGPF